MKSARAGFTLIELLVVISIIALLSSVVLSSLNTARSKSRDARRMADVKSIQAAVELYRNDNSSFPTTNGAWRGNCSGYGGYGLTGVGGYVPGLAPAYISILPQEQKPTAAGTCYLYRSDGRDYMILSHQSVENMPVPVGFRRPSQSTQNTYALYTDGARTW